MKTPALSFFLLLMGCASTSPPKERPLSAADHRVEAERHDQVAKEQETLARKEAAAKAADGPVGRCVEPAMTPEPTSGGERLMLERPCWTVADPSKARLREADRNRKDAAAHRRAATGLETAEARACAGLGSAERAYSPFAHPEDIVKSERVVEKGVLLGARVVFRKVPGMNREWMEQSLACHAARVAATGYDQDFMPYCPCAVRAVSFEVTDVTQGVQVTITSTDVLAATAVWGRVQELVNRPASP